MFQANTSDSPTSPENMDWSSYYPAYATEQQSEDLSLPKKLSKDVEVVDIGCGFGGLLVALAPKLPDTLMLGTARLPFPMTEHD